MKVEVDVLGSPSLIPVIVFVVVFVDVKQNCACTWSQSWGAV